MEDSVGSAIVAQLTASRELLSALVADAGLVAAMEAVARRGAKVLGAGGKVLFAGNGGSAADAQHLAAELVGRYMYHRPALAAIALTADGAALTAIGNDMGFEQVFARQVEAIATPGDMLVAMSTSGKSLNVVAALRAARGCGAVTVGLTGRGGGSMAEWCDYLIAVPSEDTPRIQEAHKVIGHIICGLIEHLCAPRGVSGAERVPSVSRA